MIDKTSSDSAYRDAPPNSSGARDALSSVGSENISKKDRIEASKGFSELLDKLASIDPNQRDGVYYDPDGLFMERQFTTPYDDKDNASVITVKKALEPAITSELIIDRIDRDGQYGEVLRYVYNGGFVEAHVYEPDLSDGRICNVTTHLVGAEEVEKLKSFIYSERLFVQVGK